MAANRPLEGRGGLSGDLEALLESAEAADVTLEVSGCRLRAHRAILAARSPVLRTKLRDLALGGGSLTIHISDMEEAVVRLLLHFLYTDQVPNISFYAAPLLVAADKYGIPLLKELCEEALVREIDVANASEMAVLAVKCSCTKLKEVSIDFIRNHNEVLATSGWEDAIFSHPRAVAQICRLMAGKPSEKREESAPPEEHLQRGHPEGEEEEEEEEEETAVAPLECGAAVDVNPEPGGSSLVGLAGSRAAEEPLTRTRRKVARLDRVVDWLHTIPAPRVHRAAAAGAIPNWQPAGDINKKLLEAAKDGAMKELRRLLRKGADVMMQDGYKMTALHWAAERGHVKVVQYLLMKGADVDARDRWRRTPLHRAAAQGRQSVVTALLEAGADQDPIDIMGNTPAILGNLKDIQNM